MKTCEKCGTANDDIALFCISCGAPLPAEAAVIDETVTEADEVINETVIEAADETCEPAPEPVNETPAAASVYDAPIPAPVYVSPAEVSEPEPVPVNPGPAPADTPKKGEHTVKGRAFGIIGFILNLDALLCCLVPGANFGALIYAIVGLIFCHISNNNTNFRLTKVAKVFGILALIFSIVTIIVYSLLAFLAFEAIVHDPQVQDFLGRFFY